MRVCVCVCGCACVCVCGWLCVCLFVWLSVCLLWVTIVLHSGFRGFLQQTLWNLEPIQGDLNSMDHEVGSGFREKFRACHFGGAGP